MRYIKLSGGTMFCGTDFEEFLYTDFTNAQLDDYLADLVAENADEYAYMVWGWGVYSAEEYAEEAEITVEEAEEMKEDYFAETWGEWEEITEQEYEDNGGSLKIVTLKPMMEVE